MVVDQVESLCEEKEIEFDMLRDWIRFFWITHNLIYVEAVMKETKKKTKC